MSLHGLKKKTFSSFQLFCDPIESELKNLPMRLINCNFETWLNQHPYHKDTIYREIYPFHIFEEIDFDSKYLNQVQTISFNYINYDIKLLETELQDNGRFLTKFEVQTTAEFKKQEWENSIWSGKFGIVYEKNFHFITAFTKKEESKDYWDKFSKGTFEKVSQNRSLPLSSLLFKGLVFEISKELFGEDGKHYHKFKIIKNGIGDLPEIPLKRTEEFSHFAPLFSQKRDRWICHSFNEDKAHRIGLYNGNQCKELYVVFCNPTYTRHHRCNYDNVHIVSLFEFAFRNSKKVLSKYDCQIRFLQNHLNMPEEYSKEELLREINSPSKDNYEIYKSELMEALGMMKIIPTNRYDLLYYLSAMNLLNSWINRKIKGDRNVELYSDMYSFKQYLSDTISQLITKDNLGAKIFIDKDLIIIDLDNFQFSFHNLQKNK